MNIDINGGIVYCNGEEIGVARGCEYLVPKDYVPDFQSLSLAGHNMSGEITVNLNMSKNNIRRLIKSMFPGSLLARGYCIENKRGRNILREIK